MKIEDTMVVSATVVGDTIGKIYSQRRMIDSMTTSNGMTTIKLIPEDSFYAEATTFKDKAHFIESWSSSADEIRELNKYMKCVDLSIGRSPDSLFINYIHNYESDYYEFPLSDIKVELINSHLRITYENAMGDTSSMTFTKYKITEF
jgi:hypothetical protein